MYYYKHACKEKLVCSLHIDGMITLKQSCSLIRNPLAWQRENEYHYWGTAKTNIIYIAKSIEKLGPSQKAENLLSIDRSLEMKMLKTKNMKMNVQYPTPKEEHVVAIITSATTL